MGFPFVVHLAHAFPIRHSKRYYFIFFFIPLFPIVTPLSILLPLNSFSLYAQSPEYGYQLLPVHSARIPMTASFATVNNVAMFAAPPSPAIRHPFYVMLRLWIPGLHSCLANNLRMIVKKSSCPVSWRTF